MPEGLVRILRPDGKVEKGQKVPSINPKDLIHLYRVMLLNRRVDERMTTLQRQGRIGFYIGSVGEEAAIIGSAFALEEKDWIIPCYRELGAALLRGFSLFEFCCQLFGNAQDSIKGRQMPNHYASAKLRFGSISSPVANQIPYATGIGLAARLRGTAEAVLVYFGEGATSEGDFHVAVNFAGVYKTPTIFLCRNNQWAISMPRELQTASKSIAIKAKAYGIEGVQVDGNDIFGVYSVTREAVDRARRGEGPTLIEAVTYRLGAHSTSDDPRAYRDDEEVEGWKEKDPLCRFKLYLMAEGHWGEEKDAHLEEEIKNEIQAALKKSERIGPPSIDTMFEDVLDRVPWHLKEQLEELRRVQELDAVQQEA
ncbi:pyruvate dehydrogenase (acetyl-transferring) E1 component subunit alpha [Acidobacteria bacterium AH-259-A15]|nr:pyruvate dehydrogenase (acetyl-transferring) E1 component subunit alpha [Acidobacteria bacterium AH-259-A15]